MKKLAEIVGESIVIKIAIFAACPGGEGGVLKTLGPKGLAGSNPVCSVERKII